MVHRRRTGTTSVTGPVEKPLQCASQHQSNSNTTLIEMVFRASALGVKKRSTKKSGVEWEEEKQVYRACTKEQIKGTVVKHLVSQIT